LAVVLVGVLVGPDAPVGRVEVRQRREVDVAEVTGLVLLEGLFATGVRREHPMIVLLLDVEGVLLVHSLEVDDARFAVLVGPWTMRSQTSSAGIESGSPTSM